MTVAPFVSVILPTYNRKNLARRAILSVLAQSYKNLECIVVDDCSTDGTLDLLTTMMKSDPRLKVVSHLRNLHASAARNTGLAAICGDLVAFLDDDDTWLPDKLEKQVDCLMTALPNVGMVYCWFDVYRGTEVVDTRRSTLRGNVFDHMLLSQPLGNASTLLVRKEVIDRIGGFDETLPRGNDGDFIRRLSQHYEVEVVPEVLVHYFVDHGGHPRITGVSRESRMKGIRSHEIKLVKFEKEFKKRPVLHSKLLGLIAQQYAIIGDAKNALSYQLRAFRVSLTPLSTYVSLLRMIYYLLFRRTKNR